MTIKELRRPAFEQAVIDRMKEGGFLEVEIRVECLVRSADGYYDGSVDAYWHFWNAALDGAPVQQVSVPDISAMARILADRNADACNVNREDNWAIYGQDYIDDVTAMLSASPAAPAADAGLVEALETAVDYLNANYLSSISSGSTLHRKMRAALAAHRAQGDSHDQ